MPDVRSRKKKCRKCNARNVIPKRQLISMFGVDVFVKCQKKPTNLIITSPIKHDISFKNIILKITSTSLNHFPFNLFLSITSLSIYFYNLFLSITSLSNLPPPSFASLQIGKPKDISCNWLFLKLKTKLLLGL